MSDQRIPISQLSETQTAPDASYIAIDDGSLTKKITVENFNSTSTASAQQYANQAAASAQTVEDNIATSAAQIREATLAAREATQASTSATASATSAYDSASLAQNYSVNAATSAGQAMNAADTVAQGVTESKGYAEDSEAWAVGKRNGSDVPSSDVAYHNNAKYYSDNATTAATSAASDADRAEAAADSINLPDPTLTVSGTAADSKVAGDAVRSLADMLETKTVSDVSIAIVDDAAGGLPLKKLTANIVPAQAGSGDPSPDNVRPISGYTGITFTRTDGENPPGAADTYAVTFPTAAGTVYGGTLTVNSDGSGTLTVDRHAITLNGSQSISASSNNRFFVGILEAMRIDTSNQRTESSVTSERFAPTTWAGLAQDAGDLHCAPVYGTGIAWRNDAITTAADWTTYFTNNPTTFSYKIANPTTYALSAVDVVQMLSGVNNVWMDVEGALSIIYYVDAHKNYAELVDIRVMANGATAATAGDAVREQVTEINDNLEPYTSETYYRQFFARKGLGVTVGRPVSVVDSNNRLSIADLQYADNSITITVDSGYRFGVVTCDSNNICLSDSGWKTAAYTIPAGTYFHITMSKTDNTEIMLDALPNIHIKEFGFSVVDKSFIAVREQFTEINDTLEPYTSEMWYRKLFERKGLQISVGRAVTATDSTIRLAIVSLQYASGDITITINSGYRFGVVTCDSNNICLSDSGWKTTAYTITAGTYFHISVSKTDNTEITLNEISNLHVDEAGFSAVDKTLDEFDKKLTAENLAIIKEYIEGYIGEDGSLVSPSDSNERTTGFIELGSATNVTVQQWGTPVGNGLWTGVSYYDSNYTFIIRHAYLVAGTYSVRKFTPPNGTAYFRVSFRQGGDILMMVQLGTLASPYRMSKADIYALNHSDEEVSVPSPYAFVKTINHRGYNSIAPENTLPAYKLSKLFGFEYGETDISFTSDSVAVLLHDSTIDRTSNGTGNISGMTYEQALQYDFGSWKSAEYAGTKIPTFAEFIALCKNIGLKPYVELKTGTRAQIEGLVDTVKKYGMTDVTTWISFQSTLLSYVVGKDDRARIGFLNAYGTDVSLTDIETAQALQTGENEVFIDVQIGGLTSAGVGLAVDAGIPIEVYDGTATNVLTMDAYITGVTSDKVVTSKALYDANIE